MSSWSVDKRQDAVNSERLATTRSPAGEAFQALLGQVVGLTRLFSAVGEQLARPAGQTLARWLVLAELAERPATVAEVARRLRLARQSVQRVADLLVQDGLAVYEDNPRHRRAKLLALTLAGRGALARIEAPQAAWADAVGAQLGEARLREASAILAEVMQAVEASRGS